LSKKKDDNDKTVNEKNDNEIFNLLELAGKANKQAAIDCIDELIINSELSTLPLVLIKASLLRKQKLHSSSNRLLKTIGFEKDLELLTELLLDNDDYNLYFDKDFMEKTIINFLKKANITDGSFCSIAISTDDTINLLRELNKDLENGVFSERALKKQSDEVPIISNDELFFYNEHVSYFFHGEYFLLCEFLTDTFICKYSEYNSGLYIYDSIECNIRKTKDMIELKNIINLMICKIDKQIFIN